MELQNIQDNKYRNEFKRLLHNTIFSYPFYEKNDMELVEDAKSRSNELCEFALYRIENHDSKIVPVQGQAFKIQFLSLKPLVEDVKFNIASIKLSSFIYPSKAIASISDKNAPSLYSTFDNQVIRKYYDLFNKIEKLSGCMVLLTRCLFAMGKSGTYCVNIIPIEDEKNIAKIIRFHFKKERINFIKDFFNMKYDNFNFGPVDIDIANNILSEFKPILEAELEKMHEIIKEDNQDDIVDYDEPLQKDLDRDNFDALTDGQYGDYESFDYTEDGDRY